MSRLWRPIMQLFNNKNMDIYFYEVHTRSEGGMILDALKKKVEILSTSIYSKIPLFTPWNWLFSLIQRINLREQNVPSEGKNDLQKVGGEGFFLKNIQPGKIFFKCYFSLPPTRSQSVQRTHELIVSSLCSYNRRIWSDSSV